MTIARAKGAGFSVGEKLTSAVAEVMDLNPTYAIDKRSGQTDSLASVVTCTGAGRILKSYATGADANTTYLVSGANALIDIPSLTANRVYTLSTTNASAGDRIVIVNRSSVYTLTVNGTTTLAQLGFSAFNGSDSGWGEFLYTGVAWVLWKAALPPVLTPTTFTANGTYVAPRGHGLVMLIGYGGGGGGGGGTPAGTVGGESACGGGGGGGSHLRTRIVEVIAGSSYAVTIGVGGTAGAASTAGGDGGDTIFGALATFMGAGGGASSSGNTSGTGLATRGGSPVRSVSGFYPQRIAVVNYSDLVQTSPGGGGAGINAAGGFQALQGTGSVEGYVSATGGNFGVTGGGYVGGGGGGSGGSGPGGTGASGGGGGAGSAGTGFNGTSGAAGVDNTGAGGGGGGAGGQGAAAGGAAGVGGAGGSGHLIVIPLR